MKNIGSKSIDITDGEYDYFLKLVDKFTDDKGKSGLDYFENLFDTDGEGFITLIRTEKSIPWAILFFMQQVMINQRMRATDIILQPSKEILDRLGSLDARVSALEGVE